MNGFHRFSHRLTAVLLVSLGAGAWMAQAQLNNTGQDKCYDGANLVTCTTVTTGDGATVTYPRQDARFGRDAEANAGMLRKTGGGAAGFDFTPLAADGSEITLIGAPPVPSVTPACIRDNQTRLIWEVKTNDNGLRDKNWTYTWYAPTNANPGTPDGTDNCFDKIRCDTRKFIVDVNAAGLCGYTGWRLPTTRELLSIVHNGAVNLAIDANYFPNTVSDWYWSSDTYAPDPADAWYVSFFNGRAYSYYKSYANRVRLVRNGQ